MFNENEPPSLDSINFAAVQFFDPQFINVSATTTTTTIQSNNRLHALHFIQESMSALEISENIDAATAAGVTLTPINEMKPKTIEATDTSSCISSSIAIGGRLLRARTNQNNTMLDENRSKGKRRSILKAKKCHIMKLSTPKITKSIEKLYLNKSLGHFKITHLETIYEEEPDIGTGDREDCNGPSVIRHRSIFGLKKLKRSINLPDGLNTTKIMKERRKRRIRKLLGRTRPFKKVSMKDFLKHLGSSELATISTRPICGQYIATGSSSSSSSSSLGMSED